MLSVDLANAFPYLSPAHSPDDTAPVHAFGSADAPVTRYFSQRLLVSYVIDEPGALMFVRERDVRTDADRDELHARALENLRRYTAKKRLRFEARGATHHARLDGQHDASLLLLDELWDAPTGVQHHEGELVAAVPSRSTLVFTGTATACGLDELRAHQKRTSLSAELFVRRDGRWRPFPD